VKLRDLAGIAAAAASKPPHSGPSGTNRATAASLGMAIGVISAWGFQQGTGITPPAEVATAWGVLTTTVVGAIWSKVGGIG